MSAKAFAALLAALMVLTGISLAVENKGADNLVLEGGKSGKVPFPHHRHQNVLEDCTICHELFPQQAGAVDKLKAEGRLEPKQVMNKLCTKCHKDKKAAGEKTGPVTCKQCHVKEG